MNRGRKPAKTSFGKDWKEIFRSSVGYYLQSIIVELASPSTSDNGFESKTKLKPKNPLPEIEETEKPFEIPKSWDWYRLGELCNYGSSSKAEPKNLNDSTWVLDLEDIEKESSILLAKVRFAERNSLSTKSVFKKGDVLYSKLRPYLDKVIVADEDGVCTTEILPLSFSEEINPNFLLLTLKLRSFLNYVSGVTKGMKMPRLGTKEGKMALIPLPSLAEQNKILNFLADLENNSLKTDDCYFDKEVEGKIVNLQNSQLKGSEISTELNHQLALVKELRQAYLREAMQGKLVPQDERDEPAEILLEKIKAEKEKLIAEKRIKRDKPLPPINAEEIPFEIPEHWTWCRLGEICESIVDCPHSTPKYLDQDTGFYGIDTNCIDDKGNIVKLRSLSEESYIERIRRLIPTENDIVYSREGSIGLAAFIPPNKNICLGQRVMLLRSSKMISLKYLKLVVSAEDYKNRLLEKHRGIGAKHVNVKDIVNSLISLPPLAEQERIVAKLEKLMKFCDELEANITFGIKNADQLLQTALKEALEPK